MPTSPFAPAAPVVPVLSLPLAKKHLRVFVDDEDELILMWLEAAQSAASEFLNRHVYADEASMSGAIAAAPAALAAATAAYDVATAAALEIDASIDRDMALFAAKDAYASAQSAVRMTHQGMVANSQVKAGMLLTLGHLYFNREDVVTAVTTVQLPSGARSLLQPFRVAMGV